MLMWIGIIVGGLLVLAIAAVLVAGHMMFKPQPAPAGAEQGAVRSKDGTSIAYEKTGNGPVVVLVSSALADREATRRLARLLADRYTVINYDRRGRGSSGDTQPYAPQREVEDIEALIVQEADTVFLFGSSSGAALALEAASRLNGRVKALFLYEPPFIVDASRPPITADLRRRISELIALNQRNEAVNCSLWKLLGSHRLASRSRDSQCPGGRRWLAWRRQPRTTWRYLRERKTGRPCRKIAGRRICGQW